MPTDDIAVKVAVLAQRMDGLDRRMAESEERVGSRIDEVEGRLGGRVTSTETNLRWGVLIVLGIVISTVLSKVGLGK